tara:strand:- start:4452 stop:5096 length:645 start_codon:yes stop_codon:yes gene_type:complete
MFRKYGEKMSKKKKPAATWMDLNDIYPSIDNPRINDNAVDKLIISIQKYGFTAPIITNLQGEILAGHTRYKAAKKLNLSTVPVRQLDIKGKEAIQYRIADNKLSELSNWDYEELEKQLKELSSDDIDLTDLGFTEQELNSFLFDLDTHDTDAEWVDMPEYINSNQDPEKKIIVNFENSNDIQEFAKLIGQKLTDKTKSIWYPPQEAKTQEDKRY